MKIEQMEPMTKNPDDLYDNGMINPFRQDFASMGTQVAKNCTILHMSFPDTEAESIIVVNTKTGERIRVVFNE